MSNRSATILDFPHLGLAKYMPIHSIEWSPTGWYLAIANRHSIYLVDLRSGNAEKKVETGDWVSTPCVKWSANGREFAFVKNQNEICVLAIDSQEPRSVGRGHRFCWSPGSDAVIYWNDQGAYASDLKGIPQSVNYIDGILSPDGRRSITNHLDRIQVSNSDGSTPFFLDTILENKDWGWGNAWASTIAWAANSLIVFGQNPGIEHFFFVDIEESNFCRIVGSHQPKASPNGKRVAFIDRSTEHLTLLVCDTDGSGRIAVQEFAERDHIPEIASVAWSPSSDQLAYAVDHTVYVKNV